MKVLLCGATAGSNFGDYLLAQMFQDCASEVVGIENVYWYNRFYSYSNFFKKHLNNDKNYRFSDIDMMVYISGGYFFGKDKKLKNYIARFFRYCLIGLQCIMFKKPYIIIGMEAGPSKSRIIKGIQAYLIKKAKYISVRNEESYDYVKKHIREDVVLTADTALALPKHFCKCKSLKMPEVSKRVLLHIDSEAAGNVRIIDKIVPVLNEFLKTNTEYVVALSPDQYSDIQKEALNQVAKKINTNNIEIYPYDDPFKLCMIIQNSDLVITTKLHVGIIAAKLEKSVVSFSSYTEKIKRFYAQIEESSRTLALDEFDTKVAYEMLCKFKCQGIRIDEYLIKQANNNILTTKKMIEDELNKH